LTLKGAQFFDGIADKSIVSKPKGKNDLLHEISGGRLVGGALSQLANYSDLFSRMSEGVWLLDRNSLRIMECNPAACRLLGQDEERILGRELTEIMRLTPEDRSALDSELARFQISSQHRFQYGIEWRNQEGSTFHFEVQATSLKILDYIEVIQFMAKDVTAEKRATEELREMNEVLHKLSTTDAMTGLRNFRYFKEAIAAVHDESMKFGKQYGVIFIDVDHFKKFNDRNGHPAGDEVLRQVATILKETARAQDLPCRYGGEEFVVLCRNSALEEIVRQAEVIRAKMLATDFPFGEFQPLGRVTASIGVAGFPENASTYEDLLEKSDQALYHSKESGRNQVTAYGNQKSGADGTSNPQKKSA
jgi:diguanylate cyclase (GGDEF)-like protein/PAS domain S-box-containing protein